MVDEQNAQETELPSPLEFRKDSEEENRDSEKDEDTKELEAVSCEHSTGSAASALFLMLGHGAFPSLTGATLNLSSLVSLIPQFSILPAGIVHSNCLLKNILLN